MESERTIDEFRALSQYLTSDGHGILLRKLCDLIHGGQLRELNDLMTHVERSMPHRTVSRFLEHLRTWMNDGGQLHDLRAHPDFQRITEDLEAARRKVEASIQSIKLASLMAEPSHEVLEDTSAPPIHETIELSAADLRRAEVDTAMDVQSRSVEQPSHPLNPEVATVDAPPSLPMVQSRSNRSNVRAEHVETHAHPELPTSKLPTGLVIGVLVMCQALILFFCLFR